MKALSTLKAAGAVSFATLISRVLGLVREVVIAALFHPVATDAYYTAFRIPNLLRDLFAEGALSAAFVPTFTEYWKQGAEHAWRLANLVINALLVILSAVTLLFFFGAKYLVLMLAYGFIWTPGKVELTAKMTQVMSPFLIFVALAAAVMGVLNTGGRFFISALAPAVFNVTNILAGLLLAPLMPYFGQEPIVAMAIGSLAGAVGQLAIQWPAARRMGFRHRWVLRWDDPGLRRIMRLMLPATFGLAATQINVLVDNQFASLFGTGPVSWLQYAFRLMQLPIGIFGVAIATVNLAAVSRDAADQDLEALKRTLARSLRLCMLLTLPAAAGLMALRYPIIRVIYQHGSFTAEHTRHTGDALWFYALGLFSYSAVKILVPTFYALKNSAAPVRASAGSVAVKVALNGLFLLTGWYGFQGLALATSLAATLNLGLLAFSLKRQVGPLRGLGLGDTFIKVAGLSAAMGFTCHLAYRLLARHLDPASFGQTGLALALCIGLGLGLTALLAHALRVPEADEMKTRLMRRLFKRMKDEG